MPFAYVAIVEGSDIVVEATMPSTSNILSSSSIMRAVLRSLPSERDAPVRAKYAHHQCTIFVERADRGVHIARYICFIVNEPSFGGLHNAAWSLLTEVRRNYERNIFTHSAGSSTSSMSSSTNSMTNDSHAAASRRTSLLPVNPLPSTDGRHGITVATAMSPSRPTISSGSGDRPIVSARTSSGGGAAGSGNNNGGNGHGNHTNNNNNGGSHGIVMRGVQASESREEVDTQWLLATMNDIQMRYGRVQKAYNRGALSSSMPLHSQHTLSSDSAASSSNAVSPHASSPAVPIATPLPGSHIGGHPGNGTSTDLHAPLLDARLSTVSALPTGDDSYSDMDDGASLNHDGHANGDTNGNGRRRRYGHGHHNSNGRAICGMPCIVISVIILLCAIVYLVLAAACHGFTLQQCI